MEKREYAQIHYDPDDLDDVSVEKEVHENSETMQPDSTLEAAESMEEKLAADVSAMMDEEEDVDGQAFVAEPPLCEVAKDACDSKPQTDDEETEPVDTQPDVSEDESFEASGDENVSAESTAEDTSVSTEAEVQNPSEPSKEPESADSTVLSDIAKAIRDINFALRRLEKKFETEILNSETRDNTVKTMYKELNDYKAGLIEKAMKNVLYDFADLRETMLSQIKYLREKKNQEALSLDEVESYADDIADLLEKYDVSIYKGEPGVENVAVRQKIVRKVETEDEALVKKVAESLSYGYEYHEKVLYPEKISIYVRKR